ncbi:hypothetical protein PIB30_059857, partial [Stylosanthes scabra]|nr:hypothetical protein [Stylosanthes scabra]
PKPRNLTSLSFSFFTTHSHSSLEVLSLAPFTLNFHGLPIFNLNATLRRFHRRSPPSRRTSFVSSSLLVPSLSLLLCSCSRAFVSVSLLVLPAPPRRAAVSVGAPFLCSCFAVQALLPASPFSVVPSLLCLIFPVLCLSKSPFPIRSSDDIGELTGLVDLFDDDLECEILVELLRCIMSFSQQLGKTASSIFYESVLTAPVISSEDIVHCIVKILENGSCISSLAEKELIDHKSLRKLYAEMFLSLQSLYKKASSWNRILNVIEGFLKFLVPQKITHDFDTRVSSNINSSIIVHTTYQISKLMLESAWNFLLFLSYLVDIGGQ